MGEEREREGEGGEEETFHLLTHTTTRGVGKKIKYFAIRTPHMCLWRGGQWSMVKDHLFTLPFTVFKFSLTSVGHVIV